MQPYKNLIEIDNLVDWSRQNYNYTPVTKPRKSDKCELTNKLEIDLMQP
jgi:hypothetical protein